MSERTAEPPPETPITRPSRWSVWRTELLIALFLVALGIVGLGLEDVTPHYAVWYWGVVLPLFAILNMLRSGRARSSHEKLWPAIRLQVFHWLGFLIALNVMLILIRSGSLDRDESGLVSLLLLALASYYAGIHLDRSFLLGSGLLVVIVAVAAYVQEYLWLILAGVGLLIGLLLAAQWYAAQRTTAASRAPVTKGQEASQDTAPATRE